MNVGDPYVTNHPLKPGTYFGRSVYQDTVSGGILIHKDADGTWTPVDKLDRDLGGKDLMAGYGYWFDKQVTSGHGHNKQVRPVDGQIQPDEVSAFADGAQTSTMVDGKNYDDLQLQDLTIKAPNSLGNALYTSSWIVTGERPTTWPML